MFKHYRFGNKNVAPDSFFSAGGRVEGLKTWYEQVGIGLKRLASESRPKIYLRFDTLPPTTSEFPKSIYVISGVARKYGMKLHVLRSQKRALAGMEGREEIYIGGNQGDDERELTAFWRYQGSEKIRKTRYRDSNDLPGERKRRRPAHVACAHGQVHHRAGILRQK